MRMLRFVSQAAVGTCMLWCLSACGGSDHSLAARDAERSDGAPATTVVSTDDRLPVLDRSGRVRGYVSRSIETEPIDVRLRRIRHSGEDFGGRLYQPVVDDASEVVGYFFVGPLGFVDLETARNPFALASIHRSAS